MCALVFQPVTSQECKEKLQCVRRPSTEGRGVFYIQTEPAVQGGLAVQQHLTLVPAWQCVGASAWKGCAAVLGREECQSICTSQPPEAGPGSCAHGFWLGYLKTAAQEAKRSCDNSRKRASEPIPDLKKIWQFCTWPIFFKKKKRYYLSL